MAIKILVTGDLHLGRSSGGVSVTGEEVSSRYTWKRIVDWCINNKADILLLTGDIIDRGNRYFESAGPLQEGFKKLGDSGIKVFMVSGNHDFDVLQQVVRAIDNENVRLLGAGGVWEIIRFEKNGQNILFAGWSFPDNRVYDSPLTSINKLDIKPGFTSIGLLHCDVGSGDSNYGPVDQNDFAGKNIDVWALGHIHKPSLLSQDAPLVFYPGSPHAFSAKEKGSHGCVLITVDSNGNIEKSDVPMSPVMFESLVADMSGLVNEEEVRNRISRAAFEDADKKVRESQGLYWLVYDVILEGEHRTPRLVESWAGSGIEDYQHEVVPGTTVLIRKLYNNVRPLADNLGKLSSEPSPAGKLAETIIALEQGKRSSFVDFLLSEWVRKFRAVNDSPVYQAVSNAGSESDIKKMGVDIILRECRKLLGELLEQQTSSDH